MQDRRSKPEQAGISPELRQQALEQLNGEIRLIESWLSDLDETSEDNTASLHARKTYQDMLQSRRDLLDGLKQH